MIRPDNDLATIPGIQRIRADPGISRQISDIGGLDITLTLVITTDQYDSASIITRSIDAGSIHQTDLITEQLSGTPIILWAFQTNESARSAPAAR